MANGRGTAIREWLFFLVGLGGIVVMLLRPDPNPIIILALATIAGRPAYQGLGDLFNKRNGK